MRLSFDDKDSFREAVGSLHFNNPPSDFYTPRQIGSSSMPPQGQERNEQGAASGEIEEIARGPWEIVISRICDGPMATFGQENGYKWKSWVFLFPSTSEMSSRVAELEHLS